MTDSGATRDGRTRRRASASPRLTAVILRISATLHLDTDLAEVGRECPRAETGARFGIIVTVDEAGAPWVVFSGVIPDGQQDLLAGPDSTRLFEHLRDSRPRCGSPTSRPTSAPSPWLPARAFSRPSKARRCATSGADRRDHRGGRKGRQRLGLLRLHRARDAGTTGRLASGGCRPAATPCLPSIGLGGSRERSRGWWPSRPGPRVARCCCAARPAAGYSAPPTEARRSITSRSSTPTIGTGGWTARRQRRGSRC